MNISRPARCLFCRASAVRHRSIHSTPANAARRKAPNPSISAKEMGLVTASRLKPYTPQEKEVLAKKYTPSQIQALELGEAVVSSEDLATQGALRSDPMALDYLDDFATIRPVIDKPIRNPESNYDPDMRLKDDDEVAGDLARFVQEFPDDLPEDQARLQWMKFLDNMRMTVGKEEAERAPTSYLAPAIPKLNDPKTTYPETEKYGEDPLMKGVYAATGFSPQEVRRFRVKNLVHHRVVNQTRMGKRQSQYCLTVAGDGHGLLGLGEGKAEEPEDAKRQAHRAAIRNMQPIARYEERTIFGEVEAKVGAAVVTISSRPPGFGVRCQQYIFEMCRCAGISDLAARVTRSRNPMNVAKATFQALKSQRLPEDIARARGRKLVDVRKVYYGGNV
ncbi:MAG: 28S ribosomal protein S5, mitochondrial [Thelocarpon impressellum]|nr:MAG: 28S ribosomal protein S5, mitochondrial [Thelocarpon impressellum]